MGCGSSVDTHRLETSESAQDQTQQAYIVQRHRHCLINENVIVQKATKTNRDISKLSYLLQNHFILYSLPQDIIISLIHKMFCTLLKSHQMLYKLTDKATCFFILEKGLITQDGITMHPGSTIGEMALLQKTTKKKNIIALEDSYFWTLDGNTFLSALDLIISKQYSLNRQFISDQQFYKHLTPMQQDAIAHNIFRTKYWADQTIVYEGDQSDSFFIIKSGLAAVYKDNKLIRNISSRDYFGEKSLLGQCKRQATIKAINEVQCLVLTRDKLKEIIGQDVKDEIYRSVIRHSLNKQNFNKINIERIIHKFRFEIYLDHMIMNSSELTNYVAIIVDGTFTYQNRVFRKGEFFQKVPPYLEIKCDGVLGLIQFNQFYFEKQIYQEKLEYLPIQIPIPQIMNNLSFVDNTQNGTIHKIEYVGKTMAVRKISKDVIIHLSLGKLFKQERLVLGLIQHPFICNFNQIHETENQYIIVQEFAQGKLLSDYISDCGLLQKERAEFISAQMVLLLEYLYKMQIISRTIRPESFIIDDQHYIKLIDFKYAKRSSRTHTIVGSPHFMAPEILEGKGYTYTTDAWSLGVILYEFMCGMLPFGEELEDPFLIYEEIINFRLSYPQFLKDQCAKSLISQLLSLNGNERIGASFDQLKAHSFFTIDWESLLKKEIKTRKSHNPYRRTQNLDLVRG